MLTMGGGGEGSKRARLLPTSLKLRGGGRAMNDGPGENEGNYSVSVRRTMREREGRLQKLEQSRRSESGMPWLLAWTSLEALQMIVQKYTKAIVEVNSRYTRAYSVGHVLGKYLAEAKRLYGGGSEQQAVRRSPRGCAWRKGRKSKLKESTRH
jgi:hypothetical protein